MPMETLIRGFPFFISGIVAAVQKASAFRNCLDCSCGKVPSVQIHHYWEVEIIVTGDHILSVRNLSIQYLSEGGSTIAVDRVDLDIPRGEIFSIVGESGCGKSTLASSLIASIEYPADRISGSVLYNSADLLTLRRETLRKILMRKISIVPQAAMNSLNPIIRIGEEIRDIVMSHDPEHSRDYDVKVEELLEYVELPKTVLSMFPHQLSGGMKQRVLIAISLLMDPELVIMDEPTTGLDVVVQKNILDIIRKINMEKGTTIVLVSHDLSVAGYVSKRTAVMYAGKIVEIGLTSQVSSNPLHPYTTALIRSIPRIEKRNKPLPTIKGSPPKIMAPQVLCSFRDRCSDRFDMCNRITVDDIIVGERVVKCLLYDSKYGRQLSSNPEEEDKMAQIPMDLIRKSFIGSDDTITLTDITKTFISKSGLRSRHEVKALRGVSLSVHPGEIRALVGASGSGKSTIANIIMAEFKPDSGKLVVGGKDYSAAKDREVRELRKQVQLVFQDPYSSLSPIHTVLYQIMRPLMINNDINKSEGEKRARILLQAVKLVPVETYINKNPNELSGGQRQRVAIAKAIAVGARFLVADEPVSMLDASVRAEILNLLKELKEKFNLGILYITHDISTISYLCDYIYVIKDGLIVEEGDPMEIITKPSHPYTVELIDSII